MDERLATSVDRWLADPAGLAIVGTVLAAVGGIALTAVIVFMVRMIRTSVVVRLPILGEHALELAAPGGYSLHLEGPVFKQGPGGLFFQLPGVFLGGPRLALRDASTGGEVILRAPLLPTRSSGFARVRHMIRSFNAPKAGPYVLACEGVDPERDWSAHQFVVTRPYGFKMLAAILAIIASALTLFAGLALLGLSAGQQAGI